MKICNEDRWMSIFISHSPQLHHQMSCCVWPTVSNQNIITLTRLSIKSSHLRGWNHWMLIISAQKITEITIWLRKQLLIYFLLTDQTSSKWHVLYLSDQLGSEFWCTISTLWTKKHYINLIISTEKTVQLVLFFATFGQQAETLSPLNAVIVNIFTHSRKIIHLLSCLRPSDEYKSNIYSLFALFLVTTNSSGSLAAKYFIVFTV